MAVNTAGRSIEAIARDVAERVAQISSGLGVPVRRRHAGVLPESFERIITETLGDRTIATNSVPITDKAQITGLLREAW